MQHRLLYPKCLQLIFRQRFHNSLACLVNSSPLQKQPAPLTHNQNQFSGYQIQNKFNPIISRGIYDSVLLSNVKLNPTWSCVQHRHLSTLKETSMNLAAEVATNEAVMTAVRLHPKISPITWCYHYLEQLHSLFPWWGAIIVGTVAIQVLRLPWLVASERKAAANIGVVAKEKLLEQAQIKAELAGDNVESNNLRYQRYLLEPLNPLKFTMFQPTVFQTLNFVVFIGALKKMSNYPIESLKTGGLGWITDLTVADPLFVMPLLTSVTLWTLLEINNRNASMQLFKQMEPDIFAFFQNAVKVLVPLGLPLTLYVHPFSSAVLLFVCTTNVTSIAQMLLLQHPAFRSRFNIPTVTPEQCLPPNFKPINVQKTNSAFTKLKLPKLVKEITLNATAFKKPEENGK